MSGEGDGRKSWMGLAGLGRLIWSGEAAAAPRDMDEASTLMTGLRPMERFA